MSRLFADYIEKAKKILDDNWLGSSTKPAPSLYPHQWNWDSAFIAIGRSHYDTERAMQETRFAFHFKITGDRSVHYGPFNCAPAHEKRGSEDETGGACC